MAKTIAKIMGVVFILVGILGFPVLMDGGTVTLPLEAPSAVVAAMAPRYPIAGW